MSVEKKEVKNETIRSKFGIEKNLLTVYSYFYDEGKKGKRKFTEWIFKENAKEVNKDEPVIVNEATELTELFKNERNKRISKLYSKLEELKILNSDISHIGKKRLIDVVSDCEQKVQVDQYSYIPSLSISTHSHNREVSSLKDSIKKINEIEQKLKESKAKIDDALRNTTSWIDTIEYKVKIWESKINAHSEAIRSLEK